MYIVHKPNSVTGSLTRTSDGYIPGAIVTNYLMRLFQPAFIEKTKLIVCGSDTVLHAGKDFAVSLQSLD